LAWGLGGLGVVLGLLTWQKLDGIQTQLARQSADSSSVAMEAKASAKQAQELSQSLNSRVSLNEAKLGEVALQRSQLEELMQSLSRSRDENLVVDIETSLRLAQQQAQLMGSTEPLTDALKNADKRISRAAQPRLAPLQRALQHDAERLKGSTALDISRALNQLDELSLSVDDLPLQNDLPRAESKSPAQPAETPPTSPAAEVPTSTWWSHWQNFWQDLVQPLWNPVHQEIRGLIRVQRISAPEAALLSPDQAFFLRENLKLTVLNAKLSLLAHQLDASRRDLVQAQNLLSRYFDAHARRVVAMQNTLGQLQTQLKTVDIPRLDESFTALTTAAAGH
jgi:uroporphyrin-3 C-methyltransferase